MSDSPSSTPITDELTKFRQRIDVIDEQLQALINQRAAYAQKVAAIKQADSLQTTAALGFYRPEREAQVLARVMNNNSGPLRKEEMARLFREIMSACLAHEKPLQVAYLGPAGTFTQAATIKHFGHSVHTHAMDTINDVFRQIETEAADYGVVPVENSSEGAVNHTLDRFRNSGLYICGEVDLPIHHNILVHAEVPLSGITKVYAHQQALAQCHGWLDAHLPNAQHYPVSSNAEAAKRVAENTGAEQAHVAAIASSVAAEIYKLAIGAANIEDQANNTTRFIVIGYHQVLPSGVDKTSIRVLMPNKAGALYHLLEPFQRYQVDMTNIQSRPAGQGKGRYCFFIDFKGHQDTPEIQKLLQAIHAQSADLRVLGSYPQAVL